MPGPGLHVPHVDLITTAGGRCTTTFVDELMSWPQFVQARCPECEGEAR